jgi:hypothetical protein
MDRKQFLGKSLQVAAGFGLARPCLAQAGDEPASKPQTGPSQPSACPRTSGDYLHATSFEKRADFAKTWTGRFMRVLDERLDEKTRRGLMEANGRACAMGAYGPPDLSPTYCHCSVGYVAYMFERNLGRPVRVELLESLRGGGKACRFAVHV